MSQPAKHNNSLAKAGPERAKPSPVKARPALEKDNAPDKAKPVPAKVNAPDGVKVNALVAALAGAILLRVLA